MFQQPRPPIRKDAKPDSPRPTPGRSTRALPPVSTQLSSAAKDTPPSASAQVSSPRYAARKSEHLITKAKTTPPRHGPPSKTPTAKKKNGANQSPANIITGPYEPPEEPTALTMLGCQLKSGGIREINDLLPVSSPPSEADFRKACELLPHLNPGELMKDPQARSIRIIGSKTAVTSHQFWQAYQILSRRSSHLSSSLGTGGFLCDDPGLGKTYEILTACILRALIADSRRRVEAYWSEASPGKSKTTSPGPKSKHLPRDATAGTKCPAQRNWDICCYCVPDSPTRKIWAAMSPGVSFIHVPMRTMPNWISAIENSELSAGFFNVFVCHENAAMPPRLKRDLRELKSWSMDAVLPEAHLHDYVNDTRELVWHCEQPKRLYKLPQETCIVLTSHHNTTLYKTLRWKLPKLQCDLPEDGFYALQVGLHFISEAHEVWHKDNLPMVMAACHKHINRGCDVWYETSTPFQRGVEELSFATSLLDVARGALPISQSIPILEHLYQDAVANPKVPQKERLFEEMLASTLRKIVVLRYLDTSNFFGKPISSIQDVEPTVISRKTPKALRKAVQSAIMDIQQVIPSGLPYADNLNASVHAKRALERLYFLSVFPGAAKLMRQKGYLVDDESVKEMVKQIDDRSKVDNITLVAENWHIFTKDSPKLEYIVSEIERMYGDRQLRPQVDASPLCPGGAPQRQIDRGLKKIVITTPTLGTAVFIYRALLHKKLGPRYINPVLLHEYLLPSHKKRILEEWGDLSAGTKHSRVLITTFAAGGTGTNLQAANYHILTNPLPLASQQFQTFRRTNRTGQALPIKQKLLVLEDSPVDRILMAHHANQQIISDPYVVDESIKLAPSDEARVRRTQPSFDRTHEEVGSDHRAASQLGASPVEGEFRSVPRPAPGSEPEHVVVGHRLSPIEERSPWVDEGAQL